MQHTIICNNETKHIIIRQAMLTDIDNLIALNKKWQLAALNGDTQKGFVGAAFDKDFFEILINRKEVVVAYNNDEMIGYMLSVNHSDTGLLKVHKEEAEKLKLNGTIDAKDNVAVGIQTAVELAYHGTGLISLIRNEFKNLLRDRYQYFFTTIAKENIRSYTSATKFGWKLVGENEHYYYLTLAV